ncbi:MAG: DUF1028 domain-containing protein [Actinomycetes bacterium]
MTYSIVARCARTGSLGVAISSSSPAVASRCAHVRSGVGAVATQNITDPRLGPAVLERLASGMGAAAALDAVCESAEHLEYRQLTVVDTSGASAAYDGSHSLGVNGSVLAPGCVVAGNMLAGLDVLSSAASAFAESEGQALEERLLLAMEAGLACGGEAGPVHSAGMLVADDVPWPVTDLRVDWSDAPIADLRRLWALWEPQKQAYRTRALDPRHSPGYGVPGDDR